MAKREKPVKPSTRAVNEGFSSLERSRMAMADLVKPPSAVKRRASTKASRRALEHTTRGEKPTRETAAKGEYIRMPGESIDTKHKGEVLLVNLAGRARGAGVMFNRGQISLRELRAATALCELAERAQLAQLSGVEMGERVDGGVVDVDGSRLRSAAKAFGRYREMLEELSRCGRILVENCIVLGMPMEEAVRLRRVAIRLGAENSVKNRVAKGNTLLIDALDHLADVMHLPEA